MTEKRAVRVFNAALDETRERGGTIVMRGVIHREDFNNLLVDDYQREASPATRLGTLVAALQAGETVPDIILGMRGERVGGEGTNYTLLDPLYIIDGLQRVTAARHVLDLDPAAPIHLGATVHFNTDKEWEREQFRVLNSLRAKVSQNILLKNMRDQSPAILTLYGVSSAAEFALCNRVCWAQYFGRQHLTTALTLMRTALSLHAHVGGLPGNTISQMVEGIDKYGAKIGLNVLRQNVIAFFDIVDECWGLRNVQHRELAVQVRHTFLTVTARVISDHHNFWTGQGEKRLQVDADTRRKLKLFSLADPAVLQLAGSSGQAGNILYDLLTKHINSGRRTHRLKPRAPRPGMRRGRGEEAA